MTTYCINCAEEIKTNNLSNLNYQGFKNMIKNSKKHIGHLFMNYPQDYFG